MNATLSSPHDFRRTGLLLALAVLLFSLPQAALLPLLDRDEPRFAEASREMLQSGNHVVPTFNGAPRYAKPPLIYWCQALSFAVFGENALAARLPSLLAVTGTALLLFYWGLRLRSAQAGMIAGLAYAFCLQTMQQGRVATADALLIFFITLAGLAGWCLLTQAQTPETTRTWNLWGLILALALGGGFLAKGPEALLPFVPLLICGRRAGPRILTAWAAILALGLLLVAAWAIPAYLETGGAYWREGLGHDVGDRMVTGFQGHGASTMGWYLLLLPLYLLLFWLSALPWSPLLVIHRKQLFASREWDGADRYLLGNAGLFFIIFSLMVTKLPHYTLPAFPFLALFFGRRWTGAPLPAERPACILIVFGIIMALATLVAIPVACRLGYTPSPVGKLVGKAAEALTPATRFALVDFREPNAIWEMRRKVANPADLLPEEGVLPYLREAGPRAVILSTSAWDRLKIQADPSWKTYRATGFNAARLAPLDLTLVTKSR